MLAGRTAKPSIDDIPIYALEATFQRIELNIWQAFTRPLIRA